MLDVLVRCVLCVWFVCSVLCVCDVLADVCFVCCGLGYARVNCCHVSSVVWYVLRVVCCVLWFMFCDWCTVLRDVCCVLSCVVCVAP